MCETKHEGRYMHLLQHLTIEFSSISKEVIAIEQQLISHDRDLAGLVRIIQDNERTKLHSTVSLHALRKAQAFNLLPWQSGMESDWSIPSKNGSSQGAIWVQLCFNCASRGHGTRRCSCAQESTLTIELTTHRAVGEGIQVPGALQLQQRKSGAVHVRRRRVVYKMLSWR
jgi:hypothetical protein